MSLQPDTLFIGECSCDSRDRFIKDRGRKMALRKVISKAQFNHNDRVKIWEAYFERTNQTDILKAIKEHEGV